MTTTPYPYLVFYEATETEVIIRAGGRSRGRPRSASAGRTSSAAAPAAGSTRTTFIRL
jgi:hypothetical protein